MSLLDNAKAVGVKADDVPVDGEALDLALAYLRGDVTSRQLATALGKTTYNSRSTALAWVGSVLCRALRHQQIDILQTHGASPQAGD